MPKTTWGTKRSKRDFSEASQCGEKRKYEQWAEAETEVLRIIDFHHARGTMRRLALIGSYRCQFCGFWHVGHGAGPRQIEGRRIVRSPRA